MTFASPLPARSLGRTGLPVSALGFGGAPLGDLYALLDEAQAWHTAGHKVAVATVVSTWGSSPRPAGKIGRAHV